MNNLKGAWKPTLALQTGDLNSLLTENEFVPPDIVQAGDYADNSFLSEANTAIQTMIIVTVPAPAMLHGGPPTELSIYGKGVEDLLNGDAYKLGLTTGKSPNNKQSYQPNDSGSCFIGSTKVLTSKGFIEIQKVQFPDKVIGKDGYVSECTEERVIIECPFPIPIYGFNDEEPFVTINHPFWTDDGWKAICPRLASIENPDIEFSKLKVGDYVHRISKLDPFSYERVQIKKFNSRMLDAGEKVYGLHLMNGPASYHANGYCVKMNYPILTKRRILEGFLKLSMEEREELKDKLNPAFLILRKVVGDLLETPLLESLEDNITCKEDFSLF